MRENLKISARSLVIVIQISSRMFKDILLGLQTQEHYCTPTKYDQQDIEISENHTCLRRKYAKNSTRSLVKVYKNV